MEKVNGNYEANETAATEKKIKVVKHRKHWNEKTKKEKVATCLKIGGIVVAGVGTIAIVGPKVIKMISKSGKAVEVVEEVVEAAEPVVEAAATIA